MLLASAISFWYCRYKLRGDDWHGRGQDYYPNRQPIASLENVPWFVAAASPVFMDMDQVEFSLWVSLQMDESGTSLWRMLGRMSPCSHHWSMRFLLILALGPHEKFDTVSHSTTSTCITMHKSSMQSFQPLLMFRSGSMPARRLCS